MDARPVGPIIMPPKVIGPFSLIWRLSGEPPMYVASDNGWTENSKEALRISDREEAQKQADIMGHDVRVCLAL